jgi:hypothetical protein
VLNVVDAVRETIRYAPRRDGSNLHW